MSFHAGSEFVTANSRKGMLPVGHPSLQAVSIALFPTGPQEKEGCRN